MISPLKMANENNIEKYTSKLKDGGLFLFDFDGGKFNLKLSIVVLLHLKSHLEYQLFVIVVTR